MSKIKLSLALSCLVITLSSLPVQSQGEVSCPTQVSYNEMNPSYSLYYVVNDKQIQLLKTQKGTSVELNLELDFSPVNHEFRMSPFGDQLFYGVSVPPSPSTYELYLFSLPIESDESLESAEYLATYDNVVPRFAWVTNDLITFSTGNPRSQIVQINTTNKSALLMDSPSIPEDMWFDRGVRLFTNDLKYNLRRYAVER